MKLIVGLGNPGKEYENTRHNVGFSVIEYYCQKNNITNPKKKFDGIYYEESYNGEKVIFLKPQSFINLSGGVVKKFIDFFKIDLNDVLIINDDLDMPVGKIKLRPTGTSGGHNGLKDIERNLNTKDYKRLKIGISNDKNINTRDYVLGKLSNEEQEKLDISKSEAIKIIDDFITGTDFTTLMSKYNRK